MKFFAALSNDAAASALSALVHPLARVMGLESDGDSEIESRNTITLEK
jgi:hypothetical protein